MKEIKTKNYIKTSQRNVDYTQFSDEQLQSHLVQVQEMMQGRKNPPQILLEDFTNIQAEIQRRKSVQPIPQQVNPQQVNPQQVNPPYNAEAWKV